MYEHKFVFVSPSNVLGQEDDTIYALGRQGWRLVAMALTKVFGQEKLILAFERKIKVLEPADSN